MGTLVLYTFYNSASNWRPAHHLIAIGCGSYVGHLTLAFLLYQLQANNIPAFSIGLMLSTFGIILSAATIGFVITKEQSVVNPIRNLGKRELQPTTYLTRRSSQYLLLLLVAWLTAIISFVAFEVALAPAIAWDTVWYWSRYAGPFVDHQLAAPTEGNVILSQRHPATVHLINSWSTFASQINTNKYWLYAPWLSIYIGVILTGIGICHLVTRNSILSFSLGILLATSAMPEAHAARAGYADLWVAGGIVASIGVLHLAESKSAMPKNLIVWALIATSMIFTKSAGLGYSIILFLAMAGTFFMLYISTRWKLLVGATSVLFSVFLLSHGWNTNIFGYEFSYTAEANLLTLSRYSANFPLDVDFALLLNILSSSLVINSSYLLAFAIPLAVLLWRRGTSVNPQKNLAGTYTGFLTALTFGFLLLSLIISPQVSMNSLPGQDTALTRFGQTWFFLAILSLITFIGRYQSSTTTSVCAKK